MIRSFQQFRLLMWKNVLLHKRRKWGAVFEILLPVLMMAILALTRKLTLSGDKKQCTRVDGYVDDPNCEFTQYPTQSYNLDYVPYTLGDFEFVKFGSDSDKTWTIAVSFEAGACNLAVEAIDNFQKDHQAVTIKKMADEDAVVQYLLNRQDQDNSVLQAGVIFTKAKSESESGAKTCEYKIRMDSTPGGYLEDERDMRTWLTDFAFPGYPILGPRSDDDSPVRNSFGNDPGYPEFGFTSLSHGLNRALAKAAAGQANGKAELVDNLLEGIQLQRFPYPEYDDDGFVFAIKFGLPLLLMLALLFAALTMTKNLVVEKEKRLKESMKMMGMAGWIHWTAWFAEYFLFLFISMALSCVILQVFGVLPNSDITAVFFFFMTFATASIAFCFLVSTLFSKASTASAGAGILWFLAYVPYSTTSQNYDSMSLQSKQSVCMSSTACMGLGAYVLSALESDGRGLQWESMSKPASINDDFSVGASIGAMIWDTILYMLLAFYIDAVFPGEFGVPQPWYFFVLPSYWGFGRKPEPEAEPENPLLEPLSPTSQGLMFEAEPEGLTAGIELKSLRKVFGAKVAVKNTNLKIYEDQITSLLGHNGAGKTTTMSVLTGLFPPTSGTAIISGYDVRTETANAQAAMGLCPQHDVLWDVLTVEEHLRFFCTLKGIDDKEEVQRHIDEMLVDLKLEEKRHCNSCTLSGGMKRKLSVGIALVGGSKVVVLDEPTSGMDPSARRATWDLLIKHKEGRTMLLSTHFMDEADFLGDRVAIMSDGVVKCCGSSLFLKSKYGIGYHMVVAKDPSGCKDELVADLVQKFVPSAMLEGNVGSELTFLLPKEEASGFAAMFESLEAAKHDLGVDSYGMSVTTMEEVFLKVGEGQGDEDDPDTTAGDRVSSSADLHDEATGMKKSPSASTLHTSLLSKEEKRTSELASGMQLKQKQFYAMVVKRLLHSSRNYWAILTQLALPLMFTCVALTIPKIQPQPSDSPLRGLWDLQDNYGSNTVIVYEAPGASVSSDGVQQALKQMTDRDDAMRKVSANPAAGAAGVMHAEILRTCGKTSQDVADFNDKHLVALSLGVHREISKNATEENAYSLVANVTSDIDVNATVAWFNGQAFHSIQEALALATNSILLKELNLAVHPVNHPLPRNANEEAKSQQDDQTGFSIAFDLLFGMSFLASSFLLLPVAERMSGAKHLQYVSGVDAVSYWGASFVWDFFNYCVAITGVIILFLCFQVKEYTGERLGYVVLLLLLYGWAIIPLMYLGSFFYKAAASAYMQAVIFNVATGLAAMLVVSITKITNPKTANTMKTYFMFLPNYNLGQGISDIYDNNVALKTIKSSFLQKFNSTIAIDDICSGGTASYGGISFEQVQCNADYLGWEAPGIGAYCFSMAIEGVIFFVLVILAEARFFVPQLQAMLQGSDDTAPADIEAGNGELVDMDVLREEDRVNGVTPIEDVVVIKNLRKVFGGFGLPGFKGPVKVAVNGISVGIPRGEIFGLLGVNGAGKTTTFRMLTGEEHSTSGTALTEGYDIHTQMAQVRQRMGYCPQFDALVDLLTGVELLTMYARLRGVAEPDILPLVERLIRAVKLEKHAHRYCGTYSGGNKRKLSTAVALIGDPPIVFLDEPTTGMDPGARRHLWEVLLAVVAAGQSIVLTSHSMEECEALCTRLAIMVNGRFQCLGGPQHLKARFGSGYTVMAKVPMGAVEELAKLKASIETSFPRNRLKEEHQGMVTYEVHDTSWQSLFVVMENNNAALGLEDYSISQTTLEQVFLEFASKQETEEK